MSYLVSMKNQNHKGGGIMFLAQEKDREVNKEMPIQIEESCFSLIFFRIQDPNLSPKKKDPNLQKKDITKQGPIYFNGYTY